MPAPATTVDNIVTLLHMSSISVSVALPCTPSYKRVEGNERIFFDEDNCDGAGDSNGGDGGGGDNNDGDNDAGGGCDGGDCRCAADGDTIH